MATPNAPIELLGQLLLREGLITAEQLKAALEYQKLHQTRIGESLVRLGFVDETELTKMLARQYKMPAVDLSRFTIDPRLARVIPADLAQKHLLLALKREGRQLTVAISDPTNLQVLEDIKFVTGHDVFPVIGGEMLIKTLLADMFANSPEPAAPASALENVMGELADDDVELITEADEDAAAAAALVEDAPVVKLINAILGDAVTKGASDIHFECYEHDVRVRYRIDGVLREVMKPPMKYKAALISRFKIMAQLNIAERRVPQDGRIKLKLGSMVVDYRVSTLPTLFGEKIVLRILDKGNLTLDLATFGIEPKPEKDLMEAIANPYGMVLVTGPTGSGKTTTLYSALSKINTGDVNIMTAEDPVEYNLHGINQVLVRTEIGMTFAAALKAFLRQDPNIIMVGEIRDLETGGIAIKAALTGHMVLSTLHTNSAPETVTRLLDMGLEPFNVASALNLVVAQRLLRRICTQCVEPHVPTLEEFAAAKITPTMTLRDLRIPESIFTDAIGKAAPHAKDRLAKCSIDTPIVSLPFYRGAGCDVCEGTGLKGRQGVYEVMPMSAELRKLVLMNAGAGELREAAINEGMLTLRMDGWMKVLKGITTLEQILRETSA